MRYAVPYKTSKKDKIELAEDIYEQEKKKLRL